MNPCRRIMAAAPRIRDFRAGCLYMPILRMVHEHRPFWHLMGDDSPCRNEPIPVIYFEPIIVIDVMRLCILHTDPDVRSASRSEERRVGKECRSWWSAEELNENVLYVVM